MRNNQPILKCDLWKENLDDLSAFVTELKTKNHSIILGIDANETPEESESKEGEFKEASIKAFLECTGLEEVFKFNDGT